MKVRSPIHQSENDFNDDQKRDVRIIMYISLIACPESDWRISVSSGRKDMVTEPVTSELFPVISDV